MINQLNADFGSAFLITLAPVSSALSGGANLSGFNYGQLYRSPSGAKIAWFDAQFYNGLGSLGSTTDYDNVVAHGYPAGGFGYLPIATVTGTVKKLIAKHPTLGGVFAWGYFNALPGGPAHPEKSAAIVAKSMGN